VNKSSSTREEKHFFLNAGSLSRTPPLSSHVLSLVLGIDDRLEIQEWLDDCNEDKYDFVNITVSSSYYKRLLHQSLPTMFPHLMIRASKRHFIQIVENTRSGQRKLLTERKERFDVRLKEAVGLRKVMDMIIENKSVVVGHNVFQDLVFVYSQFLGGLPETVEEFSNAISETFPTYPSLSILSHPYPLIVDIGSTIRSISQQCILPVKTCNYQNTYPCHLFHQLHSRPSPCGLVYHLRIQSSSYVFPMRLPG
jgi:glutaredoxin-related protein